MSEKIKIIVAFCLSVFILGLIGAFTYINTTDYKNATTWVNHTQEVIAETQKQFSEIQRLESMMRGYAITGNKKFIRQYKGDLKSIENSYLLIKSLTKDNPQQQALLESIHNKVILKIDFTKTIFSISQKEGVKSAQQLISTEVGENLMQEIKALTDNFINNEKILLSTRLSYAKQKFSSAVTIIISSIALTILIVLGTMYFFIKGYNKRIRTEQNLTNSNKFLDESQRITKTGSWKYNFATGAIIWSKGQYSIYEMEELPTEGILKSFDIKLHPEDRLKLQGFFQNTLQTGEGFQYNFTILARDQSVKSLYLIGQAIKNEKGIVVGVQGTTQDITEQKLTEAELINAKNVAEQSVIIKERFLANMSHEIRTPMNGIIGFAKILEASQLDQKQKQSVETIIKAGKNLMHIINDILDFSKIEADKMTFEAVTFSLSQTVYYIMELFGPRAKEQKVELIYEIDPTITDLLIGDPTKLSQILNNLIGNALKFTSVGYVKLNISLIKTSDTSNTLQFSVSDTGIGIPSDKLDAIFDSFGQASIETTRKYGGTGLGLTISRKLIELQGGSISVKSEVLKGSEFLFMIKYKKAKKGETVLEDKKTTLLDPAFLKNIKILLVEDNDMNQLLAIRMFELWSKEIDIAENGKIAIEKIKKNKYDVVLMDIRMPEMDGYEATKYIRANMGSKSNIPIIALSAHSGVGEENKCIEKGMNDFLSKPFDSQELLGKLYKYTTESNYEAPSAELKNTIGLNPNLIDLDYLEEFTNGDVNFINEMINMFLKGTPLALNKIVELSKNNELDKLKNEIHKLKSSLGLMGIVTGTESAELIEKEIDANPSDKNWETELNNLNKIIENAIIELQTKFK
ncbi:MAG: CHASE3 domain-containing protein [Bacteroidota bacterium]